MSVKAQALVWDLECPKPYGDVMFKPSHKYVLIAYADHADHHGKNIWPAVPTIAKKTGLDERSVQRLTHDLEAIGLLIEDGQGPRGTNKWKLPYSDGGDKLSPLTNCRGDKTEDSLGDIPSGDIPSGDKLTPELKEPEPINNDSIEVTLWAQVWEAIKKDFKGNVRTYAANARPIAFKDGILTMAAANDTERDVLEDRLTALINRTFPGLIAQEAAVQFVVEL